MGLNGPSILEEYEWDRYESRSEETKQAACLANTKVLVHYPIHQFLVMLQV